MWIDHVLYGTADLDAAARRVADELGLAAVGGGRHDGLGTENRIVPVGDRSYIELLAIADRDEAMRSPLGSAVAAAIERGDGLITWAVAVDDVERLASDLGTEVTTVTRQGTVARLTGVAESMAEPCLPFFIERDPARPLRSEAAAAPGIVWIEVSGDAERLEQWLRGASLPARVVAGTPGVRAIGVGERELRND